MDEEEVNKATETAVDTSTLLGWAGKQNLPIILVSCCTVTGIRVIAKDNNHQIVRAHTGTRGKFRTPTLAYIVVKSISAKTWRKVCLYLNSSLQQPSFQGWHGDQWQMKLSEATFLRPGFHLSPHGFALRGRILEQIQELSRCWVFRHRTE